MHLKSESNYFEECMHSELKLKPVCRHEGMDCAYQACTHSSHICQVSMLA